MSSRVAIAFLLSLAAAAAGAQQLYRWTDEKGRVNITDTPPPPSARNVQKKDAAASGGVPSQTPYELAAAQKRFPVTLYTSPSCKDACASARNALNRRGVPFREVQVWNEQTNAELKQVSGSNDVPTLVVGRSVHVGFEAGAFNSLLDSALYPKAGLLPPRAQAAPQPPQGYAGAAEPATPDADSATSEDEASADETPASGPYAPKAPPPPLQ